MNEKIFDYVNAMVQAKTMLKQGVINEKEYLKIEQRMANKYSLNLLSIFRLNDLIFSPFRVIYMIPNKEEANDKNNDNTKTNDTA